MPQKTAMGYSAAYPKMRRRSYASEGSFAERRARRTRKGPRGAFIFLLGVTPIGVEVITIGVNVTPIGVENTPKYTKYTKKFLVVVWPDGY